MKQEITSKLGQSIGTYNGVDVKLTVVVGERKSKTGDGLPEWVGVKTDGLTTEQLCALVKDKDSKEPDNDVINRLLVNEIQLNAKRRWTSAEKLEKENKLNGLSALDYFTKQTLTPRARGTSPESEYKKLGEEKLELVNKFTKFAKDLRQEFAPGGEKNWTELLPDSVKPGFLEEHAKVKARKAEIESRMEELEKIMRGDDDDLGLDDLEL